MAYPNYTDYQDQKIEFLGKLPKKWRVRRLRFTTLESLMYGANEAAVSEDRALPRYIRITDVNSDGTLHEDTFRSLPEEIAAPFLLQEGDILLARSGATVGKSFQYSTTWGKAAYAGYLIRYRTDQEVILSRFATYYFQTNSYWACIQSILIQSTIENFSAEKYKDLYLPLPDKSEQQKIADFLDWKTTQIDELIAKKKQLIEKLKEKRIALITQAVTKGLSPCTPMRDSGIPWIGEVPYHWKVKRLKFLGRSIIGLTYDPSDLSNEEEGTLVLRASNIQNGQIVLSDNIYVSSPIPDDLRTREGDILICSRNGSRKLVGKTGKISAAEAELSFGAFTTVFRGSANNFLFYYFNSGLVAQQAGLFQTSTIFQLTTGILNEMWTAIPPDTEEQNKIVDFLDHSTNQIDELVTKNEQLIEKLTEYRTALITAATTGKIDVRNVIIGGAA